MRRREAVLCALLAVAALTGAGCGEDRTPAQESLKGAEDHLDDVRSGRIDFGLLAATDDAPAGRGVGFLLEGRFAVGQKKGDLPVADLEYTRVTGTERRTTRFISTGEAAFVRLDGRLTKLDDEQVKGMRVRDGGDDGGLDGLSLTKWVKEPRQSHGPSIDGVETDRLSGSVDAIPAINDLVELAADLGLDDADVPDKLEGDAADRVRRAAKGSTVELLTGRDDKLLRRLDLTIKLSIGQIDDRVRRALRGLTGTELTLKINLTDVNKPVKVATPT